MIAKSTLLFALLTACPAFASTLVLTGLNGNLGQNTTFSDYGNDITAWVGGIDVTVDGYSRVFYCVELTVNIYVPGTYTTVLGFPDTDRLKRVAWLMENQQPTSPSTGAGFQLAIWDILEDGGDGFTSGSGHVTQAASGATPAAVIQHAMDYESASSGMSGSKAIVYHNTLNGVPQQTLIGFWPTDDGPSPAPEPAAGILILSGAVLIGVSRVRRGSKS